MGFAVKKRTERITVFINGILMVLMISKQDCEDKVPLFNLKQKVVVVQLDCTNGTSGKALGG